MRHIWIAAVIIVVLGFVAVPLFGADTLELGIPLPLSGPEENFGQIMKRSFEIAAQEINGKGGIKGKQLVLTFKDSEGKPETSRAIAKELIDTKKQVILVGEYTSKCAKAVASLAEERNVPYLIVASASDDITQQNYKYVFRQNVPNAYYAEGLISFFKEVVKPSTIAILYESSEFGNSGANEMEKQAQKIGGKVVLKEKYEKGTTDFSPVLSKVKKAKPDILYMVSYVQDAALLSKQIRKLRIEAKLYAGGAAGFSIPDYITNAQAAAEHIVTATLWSPKLKFEGAKEFAAKYKAAYGTYPSYHGASAYASLFVIKDALERAKKWRPDYIREALLNTNIMTAFGQVHFLDMDGYQNQNFMHTLVLQVINKDFETIWPLIYATKKYVYPLPAR